MRKTALLTLVIALLVTALAVAQPAWHERGQCPQGLGPGMGMQQGHPQADRGQSMGMASGRMGMPRGKDMPGIGMLLAMEKELAMTQQQKDKLEKMRTDFAIERIDHKAALEKAQVKLRTLMQNDKAVETSVNAAIDEVSRLKADMQKMTFSHHNQIKSILTEEQLTKLKEFKKDCPMDGNGPGQFKNNQRQYRQQMLQDDEDGD